MKITMLGNSGSGKTSFLHAMYYSLATVGNNGFNLVSYNKADGDQLVKAFRRLIKEGTSVEKTGVSEFKKYDFVLTWAAEEIQPFEWVDYRGGALEDPTESPDYPEIVRHLSESSCVILAISAEYLIKPLSSLTSLDISDISHDAGVRGMIELMTALKKQRGISGRNLFPVCILITKWDRVLHRKPEDLVADIKTLLRPLFEKAQTGWYVLISPTTLGKEVDKDGKGKINPEYVLWPIAFAAHSQKMVEAKRLEEAASAKAGEIVNDTSVPFFLRWFNGISKNTIAMKLNQVTFLRENAAAISQAVERLAGEIKTKHIYVNGECLYSTET